ncbi:MAG: cytochrome c biogenesis CcdA family protein [Rhizobiaceae bacterium]
MEIPFAFLAGLLTLVNPCVLPVLPIAVASAASGGRLAPLALAAGMAGSFTVLGVAITAAGPALGLSADAVARAGALVMVCFGLVLLTPRLGSVFATATSGLADRANRQLGTTPSQGLQANFVGGALLGAVWSPCIGPTLGGAIALASQGESLARAAAIMLAFSFGVSVLILAFAYGGQAILRRHGTMLRSLGERSHQILGAVFLVVGAFLFLELHHPVEAALIEAMPEWLQDLSVTF